MGLMDQWQALYGKPNSDRQGYGRPDNLTDLGGGTGGNYGGDDAYQYNGFGSKFNGWGDNWQKPVPVYDPSKPVKGETKGFGSQGGAIIGDIRDNTQYMPYSGEGSAYDQWAEELDWMSNPNNLYSDVTKNLDPFGSKSAYGDYYGGYESDAMGTLQKLGNRGIPEYANELLDVRNAFREEPTALEGSINNRLLAANTARINPYTGQVEGGISQQGKQLYQAQSRLLDLAGDEERQAAMGNLGAGNSLWGSNRLDMEEQIATKLGANKQAILADILKSDADSSMQYALQNKSLENAVLGLAIQAGGQGTQAQQTALNSMLNQIQNSGSLMMQQLQTKYQEKQQNIQNSFQKIMATRDKSEWENAFNLESEKALWDVILEMMELKQNKEGAVERGLGLAGDASMFMR